MNIEIIDTIRNVVHEGSLAILFIIGILFIVGMIKPALFKRSLRELARRRYILFFTLFISLFSGTIFVATSNSHSNSQVPQMNTVSEVAGAITEPDNIKNGTSEIEVLEKIPFTQERKTDSALPSGQKKMLKPGEEGQKKVLYTVTNINGKEVARTVKSEYVIKLPIPEVWAISAQPAPKPVTPKNPAPQPEAAKNPGQDKKESKKNCFIVCV